MEYKNILGKDISSLRNEMSLTQKQLCEGICTQPTISMIENGTIIPNLEVLFQLSIKLHKPLEYFTDMLFLGHPLYVNKFINDLEELTLEQDFKKVHRVVTLELNKGTHEDWFIIFLNWQFHLSSYHLGLISIEDAIIQLKVLINSHPKIKLQRKFLDLRILNTIAFLYALKKDFKNSILYFNKINTNRPWIVHPRLNENIYLLRIHYNKVKTLYDAGEYEIAVASCKEGIELSIKLENMSVIGNFYYYLGQCYEKLGNSWIDISFMYKRALFFYELLNRELYSEILKKDKSEFLG